MDGLTLEVRHLPPDYRDTLTYIDRQQEGATRGEIQDSLGFSDRLVDQIIRRLVTQALIVMEDGRVYYTTDKGMDAVDLFPDVPYAGVESDLPDDEY